MSQKQPSGKPRHSRNLSNTMPVVSDYESDSAAIMQSTYNYEPPTPGSRTNTDLNLSVLQRYIPSIYNICSIAANAVIYTFDSDKESWDKSGVEGTMFVCSQRPLLEDPKQRPRACVFVLSRRGLTNVVVDLGRVSHVEVLGELIILRVVDGTSQGHGGEMEWVMGIWVHNDKAETRDICARSILDNWETVRVEGRTNEVGSADAGPAMQAIGSGSLTVDDLFKSQRDASATH